MKAHMEDRPMDAYALRIIRPPQAHSVRPNSRTRCTDNLSTGARGQSTPPVLTRTVTCQNMTMTELAARLQQLSLGSIQTPVTDETKLEGRWNFTFGFSPQLCDAGAVSRQGHRAGSAAGGRRRAQPRGARADRRDDHR
jgi:uncharacterized protein (TIGR03435 family)